MSSSSSAFTTTNNTNTTTTFTTAIQQQQYVHFEGLVLAAPRPTRSEFRGFLIHHILDVSEDIIDIKDIEGSEVDSEDNSEDKPEDDTDLDAGSAFQGHVDEFGRRLGRRPTPYPKRRRGGVFTGAFDSDSSSNSSIHSTATTTSTTNDDNDNNDSSDSHSESPNDNHVSFLLPTSHNTGPFRLVRPPSPYPLETSPAGYKARHRARHRRTRVVAPCIRVREWWGRGREWIERMRVERETETEKGGKGKKKEKDGVDGGKYEKSLKAVFGEDWGGLE